jgi:tRNA(fMet)-specific endonuclease VapC
MKFMLDANSCIYLLADAFPSLTARFLAQEAGSVCVSSIVFAEVALGSHNGKAPPLSVLEAFVAEVPLMPFDADAARSFAKLPFKRGSFDRLIAAHALSLGLTVISRNEEDFADVPGLRVENWAV